MKLQFDAKQTFQLEAIQSVIDVFKGQPLAGSTFEMTSTVGGGLGVEQTSMGLANSLVLSQQAILANLQGVQARNGLEPSSELLGDTVENQFIPHFSLEMETGTGKTYVYLRSIMELNKQYGFTKFIIVVPGTPIREGVSASFGLLNDHFSTLYENTPVNFWVYDSKYASRLRDFAASNQIQVLLINIEAFNKSTAILNNERDQTSGHKPVEFIRATRPIVILDEPQNMETDKAKEAVASLNPLCTFRFSATHRNPYNVVYRLGPVKAYDLGLVKRIEVDSVIENPNFNKPFIQVESITNASKSRIVAKLKIDIDSKNRPVRKTITIDQNGVDLAEKSGRDNYNGYIVQEISSGDGYISFTNGIVLYVGDTHGGQTDDRMKFQIRETVKEHFNKELAISRLPENQRLKVLSLFFIDRVANYRGGENNEKGKLALWFEEAYQELAAQERYQSLTCPPVDQVHEGYFSRDKKTGTFKDTKSENDADRDTYALIMEHKTRLLSPEEPLKFIFSHSALREGWDNPNVFQICTLNESHSEIKKRQEIGRGLRLPVRVTGERCFDPQINRLTVIANESYDDFARKLQEEIESETGERFEGRIKNKRDRKVITLKKGWRLNDDFKALWERISQKTVYSVRYDTEELIKNAAESFSKSPKITAPTFNISKNSIAYTKAGLEGTLKTFREEEVSHGGERIPDMVRYLQSKTELTRGTVSKILIQSGRLKEALLNPQSFMEQALESIQDILRKLMINGIAYERVEGDFYEMLLFEQEELESYLDRMIKVEHSIFDYIEYDSETERLFAEQLDQRSDIKFFVKLPRWFKVQTPIGTYNPDWAIVKETDQKLYLVRETKGTDQLSLLRTTEKMKIDCGQAHFDELDVDFSVVQTAAEV